MAFVHVLPSQKFGGGFPHGRFRPASLSLFKFFGDIFSTSLTLFKILIYFILCFARFSCHWLFFNFLPFIIILNLKTFSPKISIKPKNISFVPLIVLHNLIISLTNAAFVNFNIVKNMVVVSKNA